MKFFITRPEHDDTTFYLSKWSEELITQAVEKGIDVIDCHRQKATASKVQSIIKNKKPNLIMFNGHGDSGKICGHKNEPLIEKEKNEEALSGAIVYARACSTLSDLVKTVLKNVQVMPGKDANCNNSAIRPLNLFHAGEFLWKKPVPGRHTEIKKQPCIKGTALC